MAIAPITGVSNLQCLSQLFRALIREQTAPGILADFLLQMLRRGLVLDLSVAFGK